MKEKITIPPDWVRKKDVIKHYPFGEKEGAKLFERAFKEATEHGDKIPIQCTFEYGTMRGVSKRAVDYYLHYAERLDDSIARKSVPPFNANEWSKYV
jgi:hypothetical protein